METSTADASTADTLRFPDGSYLTRDDLGAWADHALGSLGYAGWRGHQREALVELLLGRDVFALMPTGTGKSLVYQLAARLAALTQDGARFFSPLVLVVSPLKSLQVDQLRAATALGLEAAAINSDMSKIEIDLTMVRLDRYRILFVAPEQLMNPSRRESILPRVGLIVIDEAHSVSSWGHDFRPAYARLASVLLDTTRRGSGWRPPVLLTTATATEGTVRDILRTLKLDPMDVRMFSSRPLNENIALSAREIAAPTRKALDQMQALVVLKESERHRQTIVYCQSQKDVDAWTGPDSPIVRALGDRVVGFHADTPTRTRLAAMDAMHKGEADVGIFTCAAGMGIDWSMVDCVIHRRPPDRLEAMVQEAGRAGRDGQRADHILLYDRDCWSIPTMFLRSANPTVEEYRRVWDLLMASEEDLMLKSQRAIGEECGVSEYTMPTIIKALKSWDLIDLRDQAGQVNHDSAGRKVHHATKWLEISVRCAFEDLPIDAGVIAQKMERDRRGLDAIQRYCANRKWLCREAMIDLWFRPSVAKLEYRCGRCDVCNSF